MFRSMEGIEFLWVSGRACHQIKKGRRSIMLDAIGRKHWAGERGGNGKETSIPAKEGG